MLYIIQLVIEVIWRTIRVLINKVSSNSIKSKHPGLNEKNAKSVAKNPRASEGLRKAAKKLRKKLLSRRKLLILAVINIIGLLIVGIVTLGIYTAMTAVLTSSTSSQGKSYEVILYKNSSGQSDNDTSTKITLSHDKISGAKTLYDGSFEIEITFRSREYTRNETEFIIYDATGANIGSTKVSMTKKESTVSIPLMNAAKNLSEADGYLGGSNWIITKVSLIDTNKKKASFEINDARQERPKKETASGGSGLCKDSVLRNWQLYMQYCKEAGERGLGYNTAIQLSATFEAETHALSTELCNESFDIRTDLANSGNSNHFSDEEKINGALGDIDNGIGQYHRGIWENKSYKFGENSPSFGVKDNDLGFVRANPYYFPDVIETTTVFSCGIGKRQKDVDEAVSNYGLSEIDKEVLMAFATRSGHRMPATLSADSCYVNKLIDILGRAIGSFKADGKITDASELIEAIGYEYCETSSGRPVITTTSVVANNAVVEQILKAGGSSCSDAGAALKESASTWKIKYTQDFSNRLVCQDIFYSFGAAELYGDVEELVNAAEKESSGALSTSTTIENNGYKLEFDFKDDVDEYGYLNMKQGNGSESNNIMANIYWGADGGKHKFREDACAIYAIANAVSNALGKCYTPVDVLIDNGAVLRQKDDGSYYVDTTECKLLAKGGSGRNALYTIYPTVIKTLQDKGEPIDCKKISDISNEDIAAIGNKKVYRIIRLKHGSVKDADTGETYSFVTHFMCWIFDSLSANEAIALNIKSKSAKVDTTTIVNEDAAYAYVVYRTD